MSNDLAVEDKTSNCEIPGSPPGGLSLGKNKGGMSFFAEMTRVYIWKKKIFFE